jgi:hypothetical protein
MRQQEVNCLKSGLDDPFVLEQIQTLIARSETFLRATESSIQNLIQ